MLRAKPKITEFAKFTLVTVHGSPVGTTYKDWLDQYYLRPAVGDIKGAAELRQALIALRGFAQPNLPVVGFVGHSHIQFLASLDKDNLVQLHPFHYGKPIPLALVGDTVLINVGSVGTSRDGDPRAACVVLDVDNETGDATITFFREDYNMLDVGLNLSDLIDDYPPNDAELNMLRLVYGPDEEQLLHLKLWKQLDKSAYYLTQGTPDRWGTTYLNRVMRIHSQGVEIIHPT